MEHAGFAAAKRLRIPGIFALFAFVILIPLSASAQESLFPGLDSEEFGKNNFDALFELFSSHIVSSPDSPSAELALSLLFDYQKRFSDFDKLEGVLEDVLQKDLKNGRNKQFYKSALARFYRKRGLKEKVEELNLIDGYVRECLFIGPFGVCRSASNDVEYEIEKDLIRSTPDEKILDKTYTGTNRFRKITYEKLPAIADKETTSVDLTRHMREGGLAYALIQFESPEEKVLVLDTGISSSFKVWFNRSLLLSADRIKERLPRNFFVPVLASKGWNQILLKLPYASFTLRISDTDGNPAKGLKFEKEKVYHPVGSIGKVPAELSFNAGALAYYQKLVKEGSQDPQALCAFSYLLGEEDLYVEALDEAQEAARLAPDNLNVLFFLATRFEGAQHYSNAMKKSKAREIYTKIIEKDANFAPAREKLASYLADDDKPEKAVDEYEKVFGSGLASFYTRALLTDIYRSQNWQYEELAQVKEMEKLRPNSETVLDYWRGYYYSVGNSEKAFEFAEKQHRIDQTGNWFKYTIASRLLTRGELEKALEIYTELARENPDEVSYIAEIARIYRDLGKFDESVAQYRKLLEVHLESESYYTAIGDIYREQGKIEAALENYKKALLLEPGNSNLRGYIQYLQKEDEDFSKEFAISDSKVKEMIAQAGGKDKYPKAKNLTILDEMITLIQTDGSSSSYVHAVHKILDYSGKDVHATPRLGGEVEEVRTILPDGTVLEPASVYGSFTMPGLCENACIEYKYRDDTSDSRSALGYETGKFYYEDPSLDEPFILSRQIVIVKKAPREKSEADFLSSVGLIPNSVLEEMQTVQKNIPQDKISFTKLEREDCVIFIWEARDMPRVEEEAHRPHIDEFLPFAYLVTARTWERLNEAFKDRQVRDDIKLTPLIIETAKKITEGKTTEADVVKALYEFCHREIKFGSRAPQAHAVLLEKEGDRDSLFLAFLKACGIDFEIVLVGSDPLTVSPPVEWEIPRDYYFPHPLTLVKPKGSAPIWIIGSIRYLPLGKIPEYVQGAPAFIPGEKEGKIVFLPREPLDEVSTKETFSINLADLTVTGKIVMPSAFSYASKEYYKDLPLEERRKAIERIANRYFPGAQIEKSAMPDLEVVGRPFEIDFVCKAPNLLTVKKETEEVTAKTGMEPLEMQSNYIEKPERELPLFISTQNLSRVEIEIDTTDKYELKKLPQDLVLDTEFGYYALTFRQGGGKIQVKRTFNLLPQRIKKEKYPDFIKFCAKIDEAELARIVLTQKKSN
jgi:tetratricopeptide (TPR) repeat protein